MERARSYSWTDPHQLAKVGQTMSGLEFNRYLMTAEGSMMPMLRTFGARFTEVEEGRVTMECEVAEHLFNPIGVVHGGAAATLLDSVAGSAVHTLLPLGSGYTSLDLSVHYLRPITADSDLIRAVGTVLNRGRRTALASAELRDPAGRLLAQATSSCMLFSIAE